MTTPLEQIAEDMRAVWTCSRAKGAARLVLLAVARAEPAPTGRRVLPLDELSRYTSLSRSGIRAALQSLADEGELQSEVVADEHVIAVLTLTKDGAP